ncbi:MAG: hypothetical protein STHCBS139747_007913 [Sporothrix thermara]
MHPLDPLTSSEIAAAAALVKSVNPPDSVHFKHIALLEPAKAQLRPYLRAERANQKPAPLPRRVSALYYHRGTTSLFYTTINLGAAQIEGTHRLGPHYHGQVDMDEALAVRDACLNSPEVQARIKAYGLPEDMVAVCDTWPYGRDSDDASRRLAQCYLYAKSKAHAGSNAYDCPLPFSPVMDYRTRTLVRIMELPLGADSATDPNVRFQRHAPSEWHHDLQAVAARSDLKPLTVHQPQGASFSVTDGHLVEWQKWRFRVGFNWREGLVLHDVTYAGRELFHRLSLSEMFVPYGDPRTPYSRKSVFDVGDIGAGVSANNLALGCDCLGLIHYFSFVLSNSQGEPAVKNNAVCMHEIDDGIGWKHTDSASQTVSITRARKLVLQTIITVGNYEYIFMWHLDQAAGLHYRIQATGILSTVPIAPNTQVPWGVVVNEGVMAPYHQHVFALRIDPAIDGDRNTVIEEDSVPMPLDPVTNPDGVGYVTQQRVLTTSGVSETAPNRVLKIVNRGVRNPVTGRPVGYAIHSGGPRQMLLAHPDSWHARRARYATKPFWVTRYRDGEIHAAGDYTYQSLPGEDAAAINAEAVPVPGDVSTWAGRGDKIDDEDLVVWHSISLTHNPRPEDYPVMPVETMMVSLKPSGFFDKNPALDVPQSTQRVNQSVLYDSAKKAEPAAAAGSCCAPATSKL